MQILPLIDLEYDIFNFFFLFYNYSLIKNHLKIFHF